jgi:hypothetical protein
MKTTLESLGFTVDIVTDGSRAQMVEAISRLKNRLSVSKSSYGFFFYAGHGLQYHGINYLIPAKADIPNANYLGDTSISVQTMLAELNEAGNELNIVVLDACRDFPASWSRSMSRGLTVEANPPADSIIVYATSANSVASDGNGRNGLFTSHLLTQLKTPNLHVKDVFDRTGAAVSQASNRQQIPAIYSQYFGTAYLGARPAANAPVTPASAPAVPPAAPPPPAAQPTAQTVSISFSGDELSARGKQSITDGIRNALQTTKTALEIDTNLSNQTMYNFTITVYQNKLSTGLIQSEVTISFFRGGQALFSSDTYFITEMNDSQMIRRISERIRSDQAFFSKVNEAIK